MVKCFLKYVTLLLVILSDIFYSNNIKPIFYLYLTIIMGTKLKNNRYMNMEFNELIKGAKNNDKEAWKMLVGNYSRRIYSYALSFSGSKEFAEEVSQEVFFRVYKNIDKIKPEKSDFERYIYKIAKNYCIDNYRKNKRVNIIESKDYLISRWDPDYSLKDLVWRGINRLNPMERNLIILREIEGFSYEEIAEIENISIGTVKSRLNRVRIKLAEIILNLEGGKNE